MFMRYDISLLEVWWCNVSSSAV